MKRKSGKSILCLGLAVLAALACGNGCTKTLAAEKDIILMEGEDDFMMPEEIAETLEESYRLLLEETSMENPGDTEFGLADMDADGIRELIIASPTTGGGRLFSFYSCNMDGEAVLAGEYEQYADLYAANDGEGIYAVLDKKGKRYVDLITLWNDEKEWEIFAEQISVSNRTGWEFEDGRMIELQNAAMFLESGQDLAVLANEEYIFADSDSRYLTLEELVGLDAKTLRLARNEIYARRGRRFQTRDLKEYFESKSWYRGYLDASDFDEHVFNRYENANIRLIANVEKGNYQK